MAIATPTHDQRTSRTDSSTDASDTSWNTQTRPATAIR